MRPARCALANPIPRLILILATVLQVANGLSTRFALTTLPGASAITPFVQSLGDRISSRDLAWALVMAIAIWRRNALLMGFMFVMRALIEGQDIATLTLNIVQGSQPAGMLVFIAVVLVLIVLYVLAARRLLFNAASA